MHIHPCWQCKGSQQCDLPNCGSKQDKDGLTVSYPAVCDTCRHDNQIDQDALIDALEDEVD